MNYLFRTCTFSFENSTSPRQLLIRSVVFSSFENMNVSKKVSYLLRKHDLFIQEYAKATPTWDELTVFDAFGEAVQKRVSPRERPNSQLLGGGAQGRDHFPIRFRTYYI